MAARLERAYVLTEREAGVALACARAMLERESSPSARALVDELTRLMSAGGQVRPSAADMGARSAGMNGGEVVSIEVVAAALHCSDRHARRLCPPDGPLRGRKVGRDWSIDRDSLDELVAERRTV